MAEVVEFLEGHDGYPASMWLARKDTNAPRLATLIGRDGISGLALWGGCVINAGNKPLEGTMIGDILVGLVALIHCYIVYR
ncbi:MAG: hypothetical protein E5W30_21105, partial [Mesorhizobium sp.]